MELLKKTISEKGKVLPGDVLKVDSFLNHQIDVSLLHEMGKTVYDNFSDCKVDKILTVEASGIAFACLTAQFFCCPVLFAKKSKTSNLSADVYTAEVQSYTHGVKNTIMVSKNYLSSGERVLVVDDFLARGEAANGMIELVEKAGAKLVGVVAAIEKVYQGGGDALRKKGVNVFSLAMIDSLENGKITFCR
ncbi:MAG: xanthine phosphoribosyltransferase [Clostridia bacterium]|nr:xanthine phosphoribosyltransferase [Clostridia bacterium]